MASATYRAQSLGEEDKLDGVWSSSRRFTATGRREEMSENEKIRQYHHDRESMSTIGCPAKLPNENRLRAREQRDVYVG